MMLIFRASENAQKSVLKTQTVFFQLFSNVLKILGFFTKMTFLEVNRSNFSISFDLHMSSIDTLRYTSECHKRPRESLRQNELKTNSQKSLFRWPGD